MRAPRLSTCALGAAVLAIGATGVAPARAQPAESAPATDARAASKKFSEGERAFRGGDFTRAAEAFEAAYALAPHEDALWNAARAWHRAGELARAANLYAKYLREAPPSAPDRNSATAALVQLSSKLGRLEIQRAGLDDVRVDDRPVEGAVAYVYPGQHIVRARRGEAPVEEAPTVRAGEVVSVAFGPSAPPPPARPPAPPPAEPRVEPVRPPKHDAPPPREERGGLPPIVVWVGAGLTVVGAAASTWSGLQTLSTRDAFVASPSQEELDRGRREQLRTNVLFAATGALALATTACALFLVDWRPRGARASLGVAAGSLVARGSF